ncbi:hypothetical protein F66182_6820 [Fusarium sp. NRRL 66182]|nr:hypothetical protein F66182_6820 [Fusarium sp. NRRL 66182]
MTTRNLNQTWRDILFKQYAADYEADVPFPVTYLLNIPEWNQDLLFNIPNKISLRTFKTSILDFCRAAQGADPIFDGEHISVQPRKPSSALPKETESHQAQDDVPACSAWDFVVYPDSGCNTSPPSGHEKGDGFRDCTAVPANHRSFELSNIGSLRLYLYSSQEDCDNDEWQQFYDAANQDVCIPPQYTWDYYIVST